MHNTPNQTDMQTSTTALDRTKKNKKKPTSSVFDSPRYGGSYESKSDMHYDSMRQET